LLQQKRERLLNATFRDLLSVATQMPIKYFLTLLTSAQLRENSVYICMHILRFLNDNFL